MRNNLIIIFFFTITNCWFNIHCLAQISDKKPIEEMLIGTWVEVPGQKNLKSPFQTNYMAPDTVVFFKNYTLKTLEHGRFVNANWKIDKINKNLILNIVDEYYPHERYEFKFLLLTEESLFLEAADDEEADEEDLFRIKMKKLPEK